MKKNLGFTLLELLVVIGIISILVTLVSASYSSAQKKARDTRRKSDMKALQNCLEQSYSNGAYKAMSLPGDGTFHADCNGDGTFDLVIQDPVDVSPYRYQATSLPPSGYSVNATLESGGTYTVSNLQ